MFQVSCSENDLQLSDVQLYLVFVTISKDNTLQLYNYTEFVKVVLSY